VWGTSTKEECRARRRGATHAVRTPSPPQDHCFRRGYTDIAHDLRWWRQRWKHRSRRTGLPRSTHRSRAGTSACAPSLPKTTPAAARCRDRAGCAGSSALRRRRDSPAGRAGWRVIERHRSKQRRCAGSRLRSGPAKRTSWRSTAWPADAARIRSPRRCWPAYKIPQRLVRDAEHRHRCSSTPTPSAGRPCTGTDPHTHTAQGTPSHAV